MNLKTLGTALGFLAALVGAVIAVDTRYAKSSDVSQQIQQSEDRQGLRLDFLLYESLQKQVTELRLLLRKNPNDLELVESLQASTLQLQEVQRRIGSQLGARGIQAQVPAAKRVGP